MKNIKLIISYDGSRYNGWQKQGNTKNTIQEKLEETISKLLGEQVEVAGSGRTDAGVNAMGQVANFHISNETYDLYCKSCQQDRHNINKLKEELNKYLPKDIRILNACEAHNRFHSRLHAVGKHYSYRIDNGDVADIFNRKYLVRLEEKLDIELMKKAAEYFLGEYDFKSFCANRKMKKSTVRIITKLDIREKNGIIRLDFYGNGFLYNMIRIMTGTLIEVGLAKRKPEDIKRIIEAKDRKEAGYLAPAHGLFLEEVFYGREDISDE